ncbi:MAG TPA: ATP-binding protein, partial [Fodinibius sp.]|nr:ATP-binding protein [Fodinibius sp.]
MPETNRIEHKQELTNDLEKEAVAFLNSREGGAIYIGIDKKDKTVGVKNFDGDMLKIKDRIRYNIRPSCMGLFDVASEEQEGKYIIKITLASGPEKPYYLKKYGMSEKGCYIRVGTAAEPMSVKMIEELFSKRTRNSIGKIASPRYDLTFEQLKIYYEAAGATLNNRFATNLELKTEDDQYNYAGYLLADRNNISIKVAKYRDERCSDLIESNEFGQGSLTRATK